MARLARRLGRGSLMCGSITPASPRTSKSTIHGTLTRPFMQIIHWGYTYSVTDHLTAMSRCGAFVVSELPIRKTGAAQAGQPTAPSLALSALPAAFLTSYHERYPGFADKLCRPQLAAVSWTTMSFSPDSRPLQPLQPVAVLPLLLPQQQHPSSLFPPTQRPVRSSSHSLPCNRLRTTRSPQGNTSPLAGISPAYTLHPHL